MEVLDPTYGERADGFAPAVRPSSLDGLTVGIISNGKQGTDIFFDAFDRELRRRRGVEDVVRVTKPNYSAPAGGDIIDGAARWHALVAGVGD
jgi:hypothetical protein